MRTIQNLFCFHSLVQRLQMRPVIVSLIIFLFSSLNLFSQQKTIKGIFTDPDGTPLFGATVLIKNSTQGTLTDQSGSFKLSATENDTLKK